MLEIRNLRKSYGRNLAVDEVSFLCLTDRSESCWDRMEPGSRRSSRVLQDCSVIRGRSGSRRFRQDSWRQSGFSDMCRRFRQCLKH